MKLQLLDILIIALYLIGMVVIGLILKKRASQNMDSYFLGGKSLPFYMLGLSNASGQFDISGTMWMVTLAFVYGLKSAWVPWLWPVFNQVFLMVYLSVWLRRSNVLTGAEWIQTRFGTDRGARLSHTIVVVYALIGVLGFLSYGFIGVGKFMEIFFPWNVVSQFVPFDIPAEYVPHAYGIFFTAIATVYVILGGMFSIVWTDVVQFAIMTVAGITIAVIAMMRVSPETLAAIVPAGWDSLMPDWTLNLQWADIFRDVNEKITNDQYGLFGIFLMMMLFKGVCASMAGPAPNYDMQKILSTRSPREASLMSGSVTVILMPVRYLMIAGFAVLGLILFDQIEGQIRNASGAIDFELVLPAEVAHPWIPAGLTGLILAGLLAAFMSTFAGTLNAVQAYIVNDIYLKYFKRDATPRQANRANYVVGVVVVVVSIAFGVLAEDVNSVLQWVTGALYGSYIAANILKWHWWRFNGRGFAWGMAAGMVPALVIPLIPWFDGVLPLYYFPIILVFSIVGCLWGTYSAPATDMEVLKNFYAKTRPWGWWKPVHELVVADNPAFRKNTSAARDMANVAVGIVWQTALVAAPIYLVLKQWGPAAIAALLVAVASVVLKRNWYDKLED